MVNYTFQAKKTNISGHNSVGLQDDVIQYDSRLEARVAQCLLRSHIAFEPHQEYKVLGRDGRWFNYTIDFDLKRGYKLRGVSELVDSIEVKGVLKKRDFDRKDAFEYSFDRKMWIATRAIVRYWYEEGIVDKRYF